MVGQNIGKYRVLDRIGRGGMGTVYRAVDETLHRDVAIKVLNAELNDPEIAKRFRAEAITVARLSHPGIATIYELFQHEGQWLMVMEFVRGETLERLVERSGPLAPERAAELCMQALAALAHAHSMGVVHRDLKPANMMITEAGAIKVMDFGIARVAGTEHLTSAGFMMGTPAYMAPEQVMGKEIDARADLYAIGVVFYRLTAGKLPFKGDTPFAMAQSQVNDMPAPIGEIRSDLPAWVEQILARSLAKNADERFQSAVEFHEAFARCLDGLPMPPPYSSSAPTEMLRTPSRAMPTGNIVRSTPSSLPPLTGRTPDPTPLVGPAHSPAELEPTVLASKPAAASAATPAALAMQTPATGMMPPEASGAVPGPSPLIGTAQASVPEAPAPPRLPPGPPVAAVPAPSTASRKPPTLAIAGAGLLVVGAIGWLVMRSPSSGAPPPVPAAESAPPSTAAPAPPPAVSPETPPTEPPPSEASTSSTPAAPAVPPPSPSPSTPSASAAVAPKPAARASRGTPPSGPAATPIVPEEALSIPDVKLFIITERNKTNDQDVTLNFADGTLAAVAKRGGAVLASMPYSAVVRATYVKARDPKWDVTVPGPPANIDVGGMLRTAKHWIVLQGVDRYLVLRFEDSNWRRAFDTIRTRTGLTINLPASNDKS